MVRKIIGFIFIGFAVILTIGVLADPSVPGILVLVAILLAIGLALVLKKGKTKEEKLEEKAKKQEQKAFEARSLACEHTAGLPLAEGSQCMVVFDPTQITVLGGGHNFDLANEKISDISIRTSTEIQKSYVSSVGGTIGGAMLFGPLGAIVGGRAKQKKSTIVEKYMIITYSKENEISYLSFLVPNLSANQAQLLANKFMSGHIPAPANRVRL